MAIYPFHPRKNEKNRKKEKESGAKVVLAGLPISTFQL